MIGADVRNWRKRNRYTQETLCMALGIGSRQTLITWEKSTGPLDRMVELSLLALEHLPEKCTLVTGNRLTSAQYVEQRKRTS